MFVSILALWGQAWQQIIMWYSNRAFFTLHAERFGVFIPNEIKGGAEQLCKLLKREYGFGVNEEYINQCTAFN